MEDDGGQYLVSSVEPEIKAAMRKALNYFEKAHKIKVTKINVRKLKKGISLWLANMSTTDAKEFSYELTNRKYYLNVWWELLKWTVGMTNHTFVALFTAMFEKFCVKHGSEAHVKLMQQSKELYHEFKVCDCHLFLLTY